MPPYSFPSESQSDDIERLLADKFTRFLMQRAEQFFVLRRKAVKGYDISFLVTNFHLEDLWKHKVRPFALARCPDPFSLPFSCRTGLSCCRVGVDRMFFRALLVCVVCFA